MNKHFYLLILGLLLNFNFSIAQTLSVSNNDLGQPAVYTFTYTTSQAIGTGTNTPNVFFLGLPSGYPSISQIVSGGANLNPYVTFKVNGVTYPCNTSFGSVGGAWASGIQLSTSGGTSGVAIPAGAQIQIIVSGLIKNPSTIGTYNFSWRTAQGSGAAIQNFSAPITFTSTLSTGETRKAAKKISLYTNPSQDFIKLSGLSTKEKFEIYNVEGRNVLSGNISQNEVINIEKLNNGGYILKLSNGKTFKFIKK
ncbi:MULTISPECIES: T9SS type A sorting domain-containing protein [unclassified Chryseobacterium]|uniref:T9SS type A sorting domain-containing protein n=1 Tax=unclassified Chryseobacterium TaxID=2593645 RepID=UPI00226A54B1|nr:MULTISPECIES: T9SS type A sorting domain-containing protein [unclassified Chryseobacterium]